MASGEKAVNGQDPTFADLWNQARRNQKDLVITTSHFSINPEQQDTPNHKTCARPDVNTVRRPINKTRTPRKPDEM